MTKPRLLKVYGSQVWQCRSPEFWGCGFTYQQAWAAWAVYMEKHGYI